MLPTASDYHFSMNKLCLALSKHASRYSRRCQEPENIHSWNTTHILIGSGLKHMNKRQGSAGCMTYWPNMCVLGQCQVEPLPSKPLYWIVLVEGWEQRYIFSCMFVHSQRKLDLPKRWNVKLAIYSSIIHCLW